MEGRGSGVIFRPGLWRRAPPEGGPGSLPQELRTVRGEESPSLPAGVAWGWYSEALDTKLQAPLSTTRMQTRPALFRGAPPLLAVCPASARRPAPEAVCPAPPRSRAPPPARRRGAVSARGACWGCRLGQPGPQPSHDGAEWPRLWDARGFRASEPRLLRACGPPPARAAEQVRPSWGGGGESAGPRVHGSPAPDHGSPGPESRPALSPKLPEDGVYRRHCPPPLRGRSPAGMSLDAPRSESRSLLPVTLNQSV